eukprot:jgi/Undpi1/12147/HiC_scaffold_5.g01823.m1
MIHVTVGVSVVVTIDVTVGVAVGVTVRVLVDAISVTLGVNIGVKARRKTRRPLPEGDIWLDLDLSRPLSKSEIPFDISFLSGERKNLTVRDVVDALDKAAKDDRVRGVLGRFSYRGWQGGQLACVQEVRDAVRRFRDSAGPASEDGAWGGDKRRFSIAVADSFGEGGPAVREYYLASAFEKVLLQRSGYVGLTGAGMQTLFLRGFFDKYGIKPEVFAREEYKSFAENLTEKKYSKHNREATTSLLTAMLDDVADGISLSRGFEGRKDVYTIMQDCPLPAKRDRDNLFHLDEIDATVVEFEGGGREGEGGGSATRDGSKETKVKELKDGDKYVAVINIAGPITRHAGPRPGPPQDNVVSSSKLCEQLLKLSEDPKIGAVVLRIDSGGGSAIASDSIAAAVKSVRKAGKPVVCSMGDLAASGGYMIASACDKIIAQPSTITGSIGVVSLKLSVGRLLKDWGIHADSVELTENHHAFSPLQELTPKQRATMDKRVGEIYEDFVAQVAAGRNLSTEKVLNAAKGRVWTGRQGLELGLVDDLGGLNRAIELAKEAAGLPEGTLAKMASSSRPKLKEIFSRFMASGDLSDLGVGMRGEAGFGLRDVFLAMADAIIGPETVASASSAVSMLAMVNDIVHPDGRTPSLRNTSKNVGAVRGELEMDDIDISW